MMCSDEITQLRPWTSAKYKGLFDWLNLDGLILMALTLVSLLPKGKRDQRHAKRVVKTKQNPPTQQTLTRPAASFDNVGGGA